MKKIFIFSLLALFLAVGCSSKDKDKEKTAPAAKTVDLGETDDADNADAKDDASEQKDENNNGGRKANAPKPGKVSPKDPDADKDRKDRKRPDKPGRPDHNRPGKRGDLDKDNAPQDDAPSDKPETVEIPANPAAKDAPADDAKNAPETADNNAPDAEGFDFADENPIDNPNPAEKPARKPKPRKNLEIEKLITIRELREQTGYAGILNEDYLMGQNDDQRYSSVRLATDNKSQLGFTVQVWKPGNESAASKRFNDLYSQSFGGQKIKNIASDAFAASHHKINELCFLDKTKRATVLISCTDSICSTEQLKSIAQIVQRKLQ